MQFARARQSSSGDQGGTDSSTKTTGKSISTFWKVKSGKGGFLNGRRPKSSRKAAAKRPEGAGGQTHQKLRTRKHFGLSLTVS